MNIYSALMKSINEDYQKIRCLKQSERGSVSVLRHKASGNQVIFRHYQGDGSVYRRLLNISHPNLPQIWEVGEQDDWVAVLEEYVQGDTLHFLIQDELLSAKEAKNILRQLCTALYVLHDHGVVHRDIKPKNIIMRGKDAVLIDFDASRIYKQAQSEDTIVLGTVGYAAPEQYGITQSDERADIYSLGVLLNIMLIGKHPSVELAKGHLGQVIRCCTMINPQMRYDSVLSLMKTL